MAEWIRKLIQKCVPPTRRFMNRRINELSDEIQTKIDSIKLEDITIEIRNASQINEELIGNLTKLILDNNGINNSKYNEIKKEIDDIEESLQYLKELQKSMLQIEKIQNDILLSIKKQDDIPRVIEENLKKMEKSSTTSIVSEIRKINTHHYYYSDYERRVLNSYYELYDNNAKFQNAFINLIKGMDNDSVDKITEIISRQKQIRGTSGKALDIYTRSEQDRILEMKKYIQNHLLEISEDLYCYEHFFFPVNHVEISVLYYKHGINELRYPERVRGKDIIDVGGFIGDSVLILEELIPRKVYTFEASSENYALLKRTLELNNIKNCVAENKALGDHKKKCILKFKEGQSNLNTIDYVTCEREEVVEVDTLDEYASNNNLNIGLIKVDIEGAEQMFLHGAKNTICEQKPTLLISIYHNADDFFGIKPLIESWNLGYKFGIYKPLDYSISREVLLICEIE